jgi:DNA-binding response OmpR family regulator
MIVIGEDDPDIRDLLEARLREAGYRIECVEDGEALVETALALEPSLVILDVNMPRLDGPAAARRLRERGFLAPILALSGASRRQDIEYALASGCTEFLRKPPHLSSLKRLIERLMLTDCHGSSAGTPAAGRERKQM